MTAHTYHNDVNTHGLQSGCPRCREIAAHPLYLDGAERARVMTSPLTPLDHEARERLLSYGWEPEQP